MVLYTHLNIFADYFIATAAVTVPPITVVTFNQSSYTVDENAGLVQLTIVISMSSTSDITVQVTTANVTAFGEHMYVINYYLKLHHTINIGGGIDYNSGPYNITFSTGVTTVLLNISINNDNILEGNEDFIVSINNSTLPDNVITNTSGTATVTIRDDDSKLKRKFSEVLAVATCVRAYIPYQ